MPSLRIEVEGQVFSARLGEATVRVGSDASCEIRVDDPSVSAVHLTLEPVPGGGHKLLDANSGRPTKVNGLAAKRVLLKHGDVVEVGPARITYQVEGAPPVAPRRPAAAPAARAPVAPARASSAGTAVATAVAPVAVTPAAVAPAAVATAVVPPVADASAMPAVSPTRVSASRPGSGKKLVVLLGGLAAFAAVAFLLAGVLGSQDDPEAAMKSLRRDLDRAQAMSESGDVENGLALYTRLTRAPVAGVRQEADRGLAYWRRRVEECDKDFADLVEHAARTDADKASAALASLREKYGPGLSGRHTDVATRIEAARKTFTEARRLEVEREVDARIAEGRYSAAWAAWEAYASAADGADDLERIAEDGKASVAGKAAEGLGALVAKADEIAAKDGAQAAAAYVRAQLPRFEGTPAAYSVGDRADAYDRDYVPPTVAVAAGTGPHVGPTAPSAPTAPGAPHPTAPTVPGASQPGAQPATPTAPQTPAGSSEASKATALVSEGEAKAAARRFADAYAAFDAAAKAAAGTAGAAKIAARRDDALLAQEGLDLLGKTIREHPERFSSVEVAPRFVVAVVDSDADGVTGQVRGGTTKHRWASFDVGRIVRLVETAGVPAKDSLPLAGFVKESGARGPAEKMLLRIVEGGGDTGPAWKTLARWRGEAVPAGGYVAYEGRLVSTAERDRLVFAARVAADCAKVGSKEAAARKAAYDDLLSLGAPAKEAFSKALHARREAAIQEVAGLKVFTSATVRARLVAELEKRRAAALALIEDPAAYPYPYPAGDDHPGQKEVNRLVDLVREVWERPFDLVSQWVKSVGEAMSLVAEVDGVLAKVEEGYAPDLEPVKAAINKAIDVPDLVADAYSVSVLAWNLKVTTTADAEERDNVLAVNQYRMMMGRPAVKIHERLMRAARGHSIEMRVLKYFAHESPTAGLRNPSDRARQQGYGGGVGENIAWSSGSMSGRDAFEGWFGSSGHHRNMLGKGWTEMGVGRCLHGGYWTQNFGGMTGRGLKDPEALPPPTPDVAPEPDPDAAPPDPQDPKNPKDPKDPKTPKDPKPPKGKKGKPNVPNKPPPDAPPEGDPAMNPNGG